MKIAVYGLWHLGCVTAACLADAGFDVAAFDTDESVVAGLAGGAAPIAEPALNALVAKGLSTGRLTVTTDAAQALDGADILWVTFDTPVNDHDEADVAFVRARLEQAAPAIAPGTLVLLSSQVPVGFTRALASDWAARRLRYAYSPENLRLGKAIEAFRRQERVIVGLEGIADAQQVEALFRPFCGAIEWMSIESAEMTKHALNAFLATSVTFINEIARLCEVTGADAKEVERGLKSEGRIGKRAYLAPGGAFAGGTLARDVRYLVSFGQAFDRATPLFEGVLASNALHTRWIRDKVASRIAGRAAPVVAILGLAYTPGTSTLRRSAAVELAQWLRGQNVVVQAFDPAVSTLPEALHDVLRLAPTAEAALSGADVAVIATEWPDFRSVPADAFVRLMREPQVIDQNWFLAGALAADRRITYVATGREAAAIDAPRGAKGS